MKSKRFSFGSLARRSRRFLEEEEEGQKSFLGYGPTRHACFTEGPPLIAVVFMSSSIFDDPPWFIPQIILRPLLLLLPRRRVCRTLKKLGPRLTKMHQGRSRLPLHKVYVHLKLQRGVSLLLFLPSLLFPCFLFIRKTTTYLLPVHLSSLPLPRPRLQEWSSLLGRFSVPLDKPRSLRRLPLLPLSRARRRRRRQTPTLGSVRNRLKSPSLALRLQKVI